jgi:hypothetical protein
VRRAPELSREDVYVAKPITISDVSDDIYATLQALAAERGLTVAALVRREAIKLALQSDPPGRPTTKEWLERTRSIPPRATDLDVVAMLDEHRGPWPGEGR